MVWRGLGRSGTARALLEEAGRSMEETPASGVPWTLRLEQRLLAAEARALLAEGDG